MGCLICGYGRVGKAADDFLASIGHQAVVVDSDPERLTRLNGIAHVCGDVSDDSVLRAAGIERARALIAALDTDADTVYVRLSARAIRPGLGDHRARSDDRLQDQAGPGRRQPGDTVANRDGGAASTASS